LSLPHGIGHFWDIWQLREVFDVSINGGQTVGVSGVGLDRPYTLFSLLPVIQELVVFGVEPIPVLS